MWVLLGFLLVACTCTCTCEVHVHNVHVHVHDASRSIKVWIWHTPSTLILYILRHIVHVYYISEVFLLTQTIAPPTPAMPTVFATPIPTPPTPSLPAGTQASTTSKQPLQPKVSMYILLWMDMHVHACILIPRPSLTISLQLLMREG